MPTTSHSFINCATYLDVESAEEIDKAQGSCVHEILTSIHTFHMEYDPHNRLGKLPKCFVREFGDLIGANVILRDPNRNEIEVSVLKTTSNEMYFERGWLVLRDFYNTWFGAWLTFTYVNPKLLTISLATRWGIDVKYPLHDPPHKYMLASTGTGPNVGSPAQLQSNGSVLSSSFVRSYLKKLTLYDVQSGILVLPWYGFGQFAFQFVFNEVVLVDHTGRRFPCRIQFSVDSDGQLACKVFGGWMNFCRKHHLAEGDRIRFAANEPSQNHVVYVSVYPQIGIETTLSYPLSDGSYLPLYVSQQYFVAFP